MPMHPTIMIEGAGGYGKTGLYATVHHVEHAQRQLRNQ